MITITELAQKEQAYRTEYDYYLNLCQMHENRMIGYGAVKAALNKAQDLEHAYNRAWMDYQAQTNAKPAR